MSHFRIFFQAIPSGRAIFHRMLESKPLLGIKGRFGWRRYKVLWALTHHQSTGSLIERLETTYDSEFTPILRLSVEQSSNLRSSSAETGRDDSKRRSERNEGEKAATYDIRARNLMLPLVSLQSTSFARALSTRSGVAARKGWRFVREAPLPLQFPNTASKHPAY